MDRADVTVVCCYNDPKQYKKLVEDLARQHYDYTLIGIDNCRQQYSSCAKALNAATVQVKTEYVIYSHQDIELPDVDMLGNFVDYLFMTQEEDILGVAGAVEDDSKQAREHTCVLSKVMAGNRLWQGRESIAAWQAVKQWMSVFLAVIPISFYIIRLMKNYVTTGIYMVWKDVCIPVQKETKYMYVIFH